MSALNGLQMMTSDADSVRAAIARTKDCDVRFYFRCCEILVRKWSSNIALFVNFVYEAALRGYHWLGAPLPRGPAVRAHERIYLFKFKYFYYLLYEHIEI